MDSWGQKETQKLRENLESQLERLIQQLADLEEVKNELDPKEYNDTKEETVAQLKEFNESLSRMISGDMTLVNQIGLIQLATQAAISKAFSTPEVIRMFARGEHSQLRQKLTEVERDFKLGQLPKSNFIAAKTELLMALKQLGEKLSDDEFKFLRDTNSSLNVETNFEKVSENSDSPVIPVGAMVKQVAEKMQILNKTSTTVPD